MAHKIVSIWLFAIIFLLSSLCAIAASPPVTWSSKSLFNYKKAVTQIHLETEIKWHKNNILKPEVVSALTHITSDQAFIHFISQHTDFFARNNLATVETLLEYDRRISHLFAWYLILEFNDYKLVNNTEWQNIEQLIDTSNIASLNKQLLRADEKVESLRHFLYQYLVILADPASLFNLSTRGLELDLGKHELPNLKPYQRWQSVILARFLLKVHGYPTQHVSDDVTYYDTSMLESTRRFQHSNGLKVDGIIGPKTWYQLLQKPYYSLASIRFTIRSLRQRPVDSSTVNLAVVNIPAYQLLIANHHAMRVIVGSKKYPTPILDDEIASVVVNPEWTIPQRIIRESIKPNMRKDHNYLINNNIKVYLGWGSGREEVMSDLSVDDIDQRYSLVQSAGKSNALGRIKFVTTNKQAVLLHDTNAKYLFNRADRALSNGCIRLEYPWRLMQHLVKNKSVRGYDSALKNSWLKETDTRVFEMNGRFEVKSVYWLAWVDNDHQLHIYQDIYRQNS